MLTIAIPIYDRNEEIINLLNVLLPQVSQYSQICQVLIVDNCSPQPVNESINEIISHFPDVQVTIHRNSVNVGLAANLLRCFEFCETEWMWLLGDDDLVFDNACELIINKIEDNPDSHFIHFASNLGKRIAEFSATGIDELLNKIDNYDNFNFISVGVYRISFFKPYISLGYLYDYTLCPYIALIIKAFSEQNLKMIFTNKEIVTHIRPAEEKAWSRLEFYHRLFIILEIPCLSHDQRLILYQKIKTNRRLEEYITTRYLLKAIQEEDYQDAKFKFDHSIFRIFYYEQNLLRKIKICLYRLLFLKPSLSIKLINFILTLLNKPKLSNDDCLLSIERI
jgi:glycosyltransferase involved in cell wall biosynthesis